MKHIIRLVLTTSLFSLGIGISSISHAQTDVMNEVLNRLMAHLKKLEASCGADIKKYCSTVTPGDGRILNCMQAHEDKISPECVYDLNEVELRIQETTDRLVQAVNACRNDIDKLCAKVQPGQGRIAACLVASKTSASKSCMEAVQTLQDR